MSKCQMKKYLAGGKAVGSAGASCVKEDCSQTNQAFSAMLAARDRQMADLWSKPQTINENQNQVVVHKPVTQIQNNKQMDINTILDGDY